MSLVKDIVILGAGPFGLSLAAHLRQHGLDFSMVGRPMSSWLSNMPKGMLLKSPGFATSISDPEDSFTLRDFCLARNLPYEDIDYPIPVETFCAYGLAFQKRFAPAVEHNDVTDIAPCPEGFELRFADGGSLKGRKLIVAAGINSFGRIPEALTGLPANMVSHSSDHHDLERFRGREVAVLGGGASAIDLAVLLHEAGASVRQITRRQKLEFSNPWRREHETPWRRLREPISGIGHGWKSRLCVDFPWLYRYMPENFRLHTVKTHLGPAGAWFMRERAAAVPLLAGFRLIGAEEHAGRARLRLADASAGESEIVADHVIAATGFDNDVRKLPFLHAGMLDRMRLTGRAPRLSAHFESSIPGLYFAGPIAAASFGPVMRFVIGAGFTSRRISAHLARALRAQRRAMHRDAAAAEAP
jgi:FAD-dependent urate hydroxylase